MHARPTDQRPSEALPLCTVSGAPKVILGVAASDSHVVANHLIAFQLRQLGYDVLNLGACTPVSEFVDCATENPDALAIVIGSINGHAVEDLTPLRAVRAQGVLSCPVVVGGNLSVGSEKSGREGEALLALGVDHVLTDIDELVVLLAGLRARAESGERAVPRPSQLEVAA